MRVDTYFQEVNSLSRNLKFTRKIFKLDLSEIFREQRNRSKQVFLEKLAFLCALEGWGSARVMGQLSKVRAGKTKP